MWQTKNLSPSIQPKKYDGQFRVRSATEKRHKKMCFTFFLHIRYTFSHIEDGCAGVDGCT